MRYLRANTEIKVKLGPFVDFEDGVTPETSVTLGAADQAELFKHNASAVTDISGATWAAISNCNGYYNLTLTTSLTDTEGQLDIVIQDASVCLGVRADFMVMSEAAWDSMFAAKDTGYMTVDAGYIGGTAQTANDNGADINAILVDTADLQTSQGDWATATGFATPTNITAGTITTVTTNTDMRGTDSAALAASLTAHDSSVDTQLADIPTVAEFEARTLSSTAAGNLEDTYDGTGYTEDSAPAKQSQLSNIANVGSAVHTPVVDYTLTTGTQTANTYTATKSLDDTRHTHTSSGDALVLEYEFNVGAGVPSAVTLTGALTGGNDDLEVYAYDYVAASYLQIGILEGKVSSVNAVYAYDLYTSMVGVGAEIGKVLIKLQDGAYTLSSATLYIDQMYVSFSSASGSYNGRIWIDDSVSNTNTVPNIDGIDTNPVSTWAAALTLSASTNINKFQIANGTSITLTGNSDEFSFYGENYSLALGSQSIEGLYAEGPNAYVTGIGTATVTPPSFKNVKFGAVTLPPCGMMDCGFGAASGQFTAGSAGQYAIKGGFSLVPGSGSPAFVFSGLGSATGINNRGWTGGATYTLDSDCTLSHEVLAGGGTTITTGGADIEIRGITRSLTFTPSGAGTIQFVGITGEITLNAGTTTGTYNFYGVSSSITDNSTGATVNDYTQSQVSQDAILADTNELQTDDIPTAISNLNDITVADIIAGISDGAYDLQEILRIMFAVLAGKSTGGGTTSIAFRDSGDTKNRVSATVDTDGNRTAVTLIET